MRIFISSRVHTAIIVFLFSSFLCSISNAEVEVPGADSGLLDALEMRQKALEAEKKDDWEAARVYWERVIDRTLSTQEQLEEAYTHIDALLPKVKPLNTDPEKARGLPTLIVIHKYVDFKFTDRGGTDRHVKTEMGPDDIKVIKERVSAYGDQFFRLTDGILRIDPEYMIIEEPITSFVGDGGFFHSARVLKNQIEPLIGDSEYWMAIVYTKYGSSREDRIPPAFGGDTSGGDAGPNGASVMEIPWYPGSRYPVTGELEIHESLHSIDMIFTDLLGYPSGIPVNPDTYRRSTYYKLKQPTRETVSGSRSMRFYEWIMQVQTTRLMWSEFCYKTPEKVFWSGENLKDWLVCGPFESEEDTPALDVDFIGENVIRPELGLVSGEKPWVRASSMGGIVDLNKVFGKESKGVAYLATAVRSSGERHLYISSGDGVKAWVNNEPIYRSDETQPFEMNQHKAYCKLTEDHDWNLLIFKVRNIDGDWKFQARILSTHGTQPWGARFRYPSSQTVPGAPE